MLSSLYCVDTPTQLGRRVTEVAPGERSRVAGAGSRSRICLRIWCLRSRIERLLRHLLFTVTWTAPEEGNGGMGIGRLNSIKGHHPSTESQRAHQVNVVAGLLPGCQFITSHEFISHILEVIFTKVLISFSDATFVFFHAYPITWGFSNQFYP